MAAYRQAQRRELAFSFVNAGMKVAIEPGSGIVENLSIFCGGVGPTLVKPTQTCRRLVGRCVYRQVYVDSERSAAVTAPVSLLQAVGGGSSFLKEDVDVSSGRAGYRKTLAISFFFKFYMHVVLEMSERVGKQKVSHARFCLK